MAEPGQIEMRRHFQSKKVHAFLPAQERSLCDYTSRAATAEGGSGFVCLICQSVMRERQLSPAPSPVPALEEMLVEFSGGRFDGEQMLLLVEVADPMHFRVLGRDYRVRAHTRASEVEGRVVT